LPLPLHQQPLILPEQEIVLLGDQLKATGLPAQFRVGQVQPGDIVECLLEFGLGGGFAGYQVIVHMYQPLDVLVGATKLLIEIGICYRDLTMARLRLREAVSSVS